MFKFDPFWSILIQFDPFWSILTYLIQSDQKIYKVENLMIYFNDYLIRNQMWSSLIHFGQIWFNLIKKIKDWKSDDVFQWLFHQKSNLIHFDPFLGKGKARGAQNLCNFCYLIGWRQDNQKTWTARSSFSLHKFVHIKFFWTQFKNEVGAAWGHVSRGLTVTRKVCFWPILSCPICRVSCYLKPVVII